MQANYKLRSMVAAVAGTLLFGATQAAVADSNDDLLKKLHDKGVLTDQEYDDFNAQRDTEKVKKRETEIKASFKDGFKWSDNNGDSISINGRIQADYRAFNSPKPNFTTNTSSNAGVADTWDIRRAYMSMKGTFYNYINFEATGDFAASAPTLKYYWLEFAPSEIAKVRFGQFKMPSGQETVLSSRFTDMTERDWVSSLTPSIQRGAMLWGQPTKGLWYFTSISNGTYDYEGGRTANENNAAADGKEYAERIAVNLAQVFNVPDMILHFGETFSRDNKVADVAAGDITFRTNARGLTFFKANQAFTRPDIDRVNVETILANGPFKVQAEYGTYALHDNAAAPVQDHTASAGYINFSWMITGENYADAYKDSYMDRIRPKNDFVAIGAPGWGAWEVGARYSKINLNDWVGTQTATNYTNNAHSYTLGLKWIPNPNTRFLLDYIGTQFRNPITGNVTGANAVDHESAINFRAQFDW